MKLSLVIPCYNEAGNIKALYDAIRGVFDAQPFDYEMIYVNDGSSDDSAAVLSTLCSETDACMKVICFSRNFGKESAVYAGMEHAQGEYTALIDADLQQDPSIVLSMVKMLDSDSSADCICAYQENRKESHFRVFCKNRFYHMINKMSDTEFKNGASDFRCFRASVRDAVLSMSEYHRFSKGMFAWVGFSTSYMPYTAKDRYSGDSKWSFTKLMKYAFEGIISFTTVPLKISSWVGGFTSFFSLIYLIVVILQKIISGIAVPGYATIVVLILFLGGLQLLALGINGEYLARTYIQVKNRPVYIARSVMDSSEERRESNGKDKRDTL
jgi:glycosyltransferase involved in cell wall biosynthesis